jgi:hypothetical protein
MAWRSRESRCGSTGLRSMRPASPVSRPLLAGSAAALHVAAFPRARRALPAVAIMAAARFLGFVLVYIGATWFRPPSLYAHHGFSQVHPFATGSLLARLFQPLTAWDGGWYVSLAAKGYGMPNSWAFFPLYPLFLRGAGDVTDANLVLVGVLLSTAASLAAAVLLYLLVESDYGPRVALWAVAFLAFFPTSVFLQAVYTESLFLLLSLACVLAARRGRWALAGLAGMLAALTRNTGVLLLIPVLIFHFSSVQWRWRRVEWRALWTLLIPAGLGIYMVYQWVVGGDPLLFDSVQSTGWHRYLASPLTSLYRGAEDSLIVLHRLLLYGTLRPSSLHNLIAFPLLVITVTALLLAWKRLPPAYLAYAAAATLLPLCDPTAAQPLFSLPRFLLAVFPAFIAVALITDRRPWLRSVMLATSIAGYALLTVEFARHFFIS